MRALVCLLVLDCLLVLGALLSVSAVAQTYVYVPDSNPAYGSANAAPFDISDPSGRYMEILPIRYLSTLYGPYKITEVAFSKYGSTLFSPNTFFATQFQLRMSHTTLANYRDKNFANWSGPCPTALVDASNGFTYTVPGEDQWADIGTTVDFAWDGRRPICLEVRFRGNDHKRGFPCRSGQPIPRIWANYYQLDNYVAKTGTFDSSSGLKVRLRVDPNNILLAPESVAVGGAGISLSLVNMPPSSPYQVAASLGQSPLPLGKCKVGLALDNVLITSIRVSGTVFRKYGGISSSTGTATASFHPPRITALIGLPVYHAAVAYDKTGILGCTNTTGSMMK